MENRNSPRIMRKNIFFSIALPPVRKSSHRTEEGIDFFKKLFWSCQENHDGPAEKEDQKDNELPD